MKPVFWGIIIFLPLLFISCSKSPSDVLKEVKKSQNQGKYDEIRNYYTKGTVKALQELDKLPSGDGSSKSINKKFAKASDWKVINEKIEGDNAEVTIKYTLHPIENMKDLELTFRFSKEDGEWKIDMQKELEMGLEIVKMNKNMQKDGEKNFK